MSKPHDTLRRISSTRDEGSYLETLLKIESDHIVACYPLSETSGTVATDVKNGLNGAYAASITLNAVTFPDGTAAPLFDANADVITLPFAALDTPFDGAAGSIHLFLKARAASVWTDGVSRIPLELGVDANNRVFPNKAAANNRFDNFYIAGGTSKQNVQTSFSPTTWFSIAVTWDKVADQVKVFTNGAQVGSTLTGLGIWAGILTNGFSAIGNFSGAGGPNFWDGYIKYPTSWNIALTPAQIAQLTPASFLV